MQKLIKNWIFTLVTCILLAIFAVLLFLDNCGLMGERYIAVTFIHALAGVGLIIYVILALCPLVPKYKNKICRIFLFVEILLLLVTAVSQLGLAVFNIPWLSDLEVFSILALAVWLRTFVLIVRGYVLQGEIALPSVDPVVESMSQDTTLIETPSEKKEAPKEPKKEHKPFDRIPLWKICCYIVLGGISATQIASTRITAKWIVYVIAVAAAIFATIFGVLTVQNHKEHPLKAAKKTEEQPKEEKEADAPAAAEAPAASLPVPVEETASAQPPAEQEPAPAGENA